jgi:multidrug efflux pump subunit AcrA (membrane-fusion protein)
MNRNRLLLAVGGLVLIGLVAWVVVQRLKGAEDQGDANPTALITTAQVRSQTVEDTAVVYGVVQADPADSVTIAAPRAVIVSRMLVRAGQTVRAGEPLVEVSSAPGSELAYRQAEDAVGFALTDLARVQRLFDERLAGADQLSAAKKTLADAEAGLKAQRGQGGDHALQTLSAPAAGVVTTVSAAAGDHVAQDAVLVAPWSASPPTRPPRPSTPWRP